MTIQTLDPFFKFYPYQQKWVTDDSQYKVGMWARQIGKTFSTAAEIVRDVMLAEFAGKTSDWIILSRGHRQAKHIMRRYVIPMLKAYDHVRAYMNNRQPEVIEFRRYTGVEAYLPGGSTITALPANPETARGYTANVLADEFAFHDASREIWKAIFPITTRQGLKMRIVSTPNGKGNKFYELMTAHDSEWSRHRVDIHTAVAQGYDLDIEKTRKALADEEAWRQEYMLEWLDEALAWFSFDLIMAVEDQAAGHPEKYTGGDCFIGVDIARRNHLWVAWVWERVGDVLWTREISTMKNKTFSEQEAEIDRLMHNYNVSRICMDQTGMGEPVVERAAEKYGGVVEGALMTADRKLSIATVTKQMFEDRHCRIPAGDPILRDDLHKIRKVTGPTGNPRLVANADAQGHADRAWAAMLGAAAAQTACAPPVGCYAEQESSQDRQLLELGLI
ncbi:MAG: terminase family protein [Pseudomonadota bacterium]